MTFFISILSFPVMGLEILYQSPHLSYKLIVDETQILFQSNHAEVSILKEKCNENSYSMFKNRFESTIKKKVITSKKNSNINIQLDNKPYVLSENSALANYLEQMQKHIVTLKFNREQICD